ncbi:MAG: HAMP domain-containing protein [Leptospira sp.]|nr:HAMP domain-containing protein [Leptospira sp.]NCS92975.1 HAMP domain-containing protein [Leptospira sp.]
MKNSIKTKIIFELSLFFIFVGLFIVTISYFKQKQLFKESYKDIAKAQSQFFQYKTSLIPNLFQSILEKNASIEGKTIQENFQNQLDFLPDSLENVKQTYLTDAIKVEKDSKSFYKIILANQRIYSFNIAPGDLYEANNIFSNAVEEAKLGKIILTDEYTDSLGEWISVLVPIFDTNKNVIAVYGIDISTDQMNSVLINFLIQISTLGIILFSILIIIIYFRFNFLLKPLNQLKSLSENVSKGNFNSEIEYSKKDEIGSIFESLNQLSIQISSYIDKIRKAGKHMSESGSVLLQSSTESIEQSKDIAELVSRLNSVIQEQINSLEESRLAMEQESIALHRIAAVAASVNDAASNSFLSAESGENNLKSLSNEMNTVQNSIRKSGSIALDLDGSSNQIGKIVESITQIASQTNLLALNAAIEAARAGDQGKGFAVVADEVSKLADKSTQSAKLISSMLAEIRSKIQNLVTSVQETEETMINGIKTIHSAELNFKDIVDLAKSVSEQIADVSASVEEISASSDELISSMEQNLAISNEISDTTKEISGSSEMQLIAMHQIENKAKSLGDHSSELENIVKNF